MIFRSGSNRHWMWSVDKPFDPNEFVGRMVRVTDDKHKTKVVEIQRIVGSLRYPHKFQITSRDEDYLISMLDFFAQMNGEKVSEQDIKDFDDTMFEIQEKHSRFELPKRPKAVKDWHA